MELFVSEYVPGGQGLQLYNFPFENVPAGHGKQIDEIEKPKGQTLLSLPLRVLLFKLF